MSLFSEPVAVHSAMAEAMEAARALGVCSVNDARILLAGAAGLERHQLHRLEAGDFTPALAARYTDLLTRRATGEPVSKILGYRDFWNYRFHVSAAVLDPRPDTETLVAAALEHPFTRVLDLGTGSGAILLSLLADRPQATGLGVDLSPAALEVAARNRSALGLDARAELRASDWFSQVTGTFDLIVSNPPYIALDEMAGLSRDVLQHDPRMALTDEADGLDAYRSITKEVAKFLTPQGRLWVEIGPTQGPEVAELFAKAGFEQVSIRQDYDGRPRVVGGIWQP